MATLSFAATEDRPLVLVVNHEPLQDLSVTVDLENIHLETVASSLAVLERLQHEPMPSLIVVTEQMLDASGLETLQRVRKLRPDLKVVVLGEANDKRDTALTCRVAALDYASMPTRGSELAALIQQHLLPTSFAREPKCDEKTTVIKLSDGGCFICASSAMKRIYAQASVIAGFEMPVLMLGESGTGKEVISLLVHDLSKRSNQTFLKVNCAAVPADLLESELFGYEAGAFTGATKAKPGKFELCEGGTILLDEIGEMPPALQAKLLHFLQDKSFSRLGSRTTTKANVRILAATNIDIQEGLAAKTLRADLYYRLSGFTIRIPPLRERKNEIPLLLDHFMKRDAAQFCVPERGFSPRMVHACLAYSWPGNLRQLENFVRRYLVLGDEELAISELQIVHPDNRGLRQPPRLRPDPAGLKSLARSAKNEAEAVAIAHALEQTNWHRQKAAVLLRISYKALLYKIRQYDLHPPAAAIREVAE